MTTQDAAVRSIIDQAIVNSHEGMLTSDVIKAALADVPRLMLAVGAERNRLVTAWSPRTGEPTRSQQRWVTEWVEVSDDS